MYTAIQKKLLPANALIGLALIVSATACSPIKILNAMVPKSTYTLESGIAFGKLSRQKLDIYLPKSASKNPATPLRKVVIFYYGGSWDSGERGDYQFVGEALASLGYIVVIPDYRVYPDVLFPELMQDPVAAARWVKDNIHQYQGDANQVFLAGHSAGAHIAVMMAVNAQYLAAQSLKPTDFAGAIGLAGPYDFLPLKSERLKTIFGSVPEQVKSQPINFVDGKNPPMLLAVGLKDGTVWPRNTFNLAEKIHQQGGPVKVVQFKDYGHIDMAAKLAKPLRGNGDLLKVVAEFIQNATSESISLSYP